MITIERKYGADFFMDLSHELKTPIAILKSNWEILAGRREGNRSAALKTIGTAADSMSTLVDGFIAAARMDFPEDSMEKSPFRLEELLQEICDDCAALADNCGVHMLCSSDDAEINADRGRIREVVLNLISNAFKHTDAGGAVTISGKSTVRGAEIIVCDTGCGIPIGELPYIFERFYRISGDVSPGTGLGLHICRKIVEAHGGTINVESEPGEGTRFVVFIP